MNCLNCGATNDVDARFCAECGGPLENQDIEATVAGQVFSAADSGATILSTSADMLAAEEAKTVAVDSEILAAALAEDEVVGSPTPDPAPPPPEPTPIPPSAGGGEGISGGDGGGSAGDPGDNNNRKMIIIGVIVLVILCCCCCSLSIGAGIASNPDAIEDIIRELTLLPTYLPFVV